MSTNVKLENTKAKVRISKATRERRKISGKLTINSSTILGKPEDSGIISSKRCKE